MSLASLDLIAFTFIFAQANHNSYINLKYPLRLPLIGVFACLNKIGGGSKQADVFKDPPLLGLEFFEVGRDGAEHPEKEAREVLEGSREGLQVHVIWDRCCPEGEVVMPLEEGE